MMIDEANRTHRALIETTQGVRAYAGSEGSRQIVAMLDMLVGSYCLELMTVTAQDLPRVQAALRQVMAIRDVVSGDGQDIPKI